MIYNFSHFTMRYRHTGRVVRFTVGQAEYVRAMTRAPELRASVVEEHAAEAGDVVVTMTPLGARTLADAFAALGGDAAVSARMLTDAIDGMADELLRSRLPQRNGRLRKVG